MKYVRIVLLVAILAACGKQAPAPEPAAPGPKTAARGFDAGELDPGVRPQDDFWRHVNGKWLAATEIPADWSSYGVFQMVFERTEVQLKALVEAASKAGKPAGSDEQKLADLYLSFMNEARAEELGLRPLDADLAAIASLKTHEDVIAYMGTALAAGVQVPVSFYVDSDADDPTRNLAYFWQDGLGLPDRDYYLLDNTELAKIRDAYAVHIQRMFELAGWDRPASAAQTIVAIEYRIAGNHWTAVENRDEEKIYRNQLDLAGAQALSPGFDWALFMARAGCGTPAKFVLAQTEYFAALGEIIRESPVRHWQTYLRFKLLKSYAPLLNAAIVREDFAFQSGVLRGQKENKARWKRGLRLESSELGELLGKAYVARHFPPESKRRVEDLVANLGGAFRQSIDRLDWMSPATKRAAQDKLARFRSKIGYPDKWKDYSTVTIAADDLVGNIRRTRAFAYQHEIAKLGKPVDRDEWSTTPQTVNAYYTPTYNEILFPAAILQPPFFDPAADDAYNYGSIGSTIGHEFSHGFDDQGRKFDGDGRLRDWWTAEDAAQYKARADKLAAQYDGFKPLPDMHINGRLTLGENIADLAGLVMAYRAYRTSLQGREARIVGGLTGDQRFFIGYARAWRGKDRPENLREQLLSDPHAPDEFRLTGTVRNMPEFYATFGVKDGDRMYLPPEQRVQLW